MTQKKLRTNIWADIIETTDVSHGPLLSHTFMTLLCQVDADATPPVVLQLY